MRICHPFVTALLLALMWPNATPVSARPVANLGTLTCTLDPGEDKPFGVERRLSCSFEPIEGAKVYFSGIVKRLGANAAGQAKIVLAWSVLGPTLDTPLKNLEGRYLGSLSTKRGDSHAGLVGGANAKISLRPLTIDPQLGSNAALSVLELELTAMRAELDKLKQAATTQHKPKQEPAQPVPPTPPPPDDPEIEPPAKPIHVLRIHEANDNALCKLTLKIKAAC